MSKQRAIKTIVTTIILLVAAAGYTFTTKQPPAAQPTPLPGQYRITQFTDGDTFTVDMNGKPEKIRLIGVDTPETKKPNSPVQCFGPEASDFTKQLIDSQSVRLEADPIGNNRDRYDRLLRYAYLPDGTLVNQQLVEQGYGFAYLTFPFSKSADFAQAQASAETAKLGLWSACHPKLNNGRWSSNNL